MDLFRFRGSQLTAGDTAHMDHGPSGGSWPTAGDTAHVDHGPHGGPRPMARESWHHAARCRQDGNPGHCLPGAWGMVSSYKFRVTESASWPPECQAGRVLDEARGGGDQAFLSRTSLCKGPVWTAPPLPTQQPVAQELATQGLLLPADVKLDMPQARGGLRPECRGQGGM